MYALWAQALDNASSDHWEGAGANGAKLKAEEVQQLFYKIGTKGTEYFSRQGVRLVRYRQEVMLEIPTLSHDRIGRGAPVTFYCNFDEPGAPASAEALLKTLQDFTKSIGRDLGETHRDVVKEAYAAIKKKRDDQRLLMLGLVVAVILVIIGALIFLPAHH